MSRNDLLKGLTPEQIEKARACKNHEQLLELAKREGIELTDDQLEAVSGGGCIEKEPRRGFVCPNCLGTNTEGYYDCYMYGSLGGYQVKCLDCNGQFETRG